MKQSTVGEAGVISIFVNRLLNGKSLIIDGDGNQTRDFIFVEDVTAAVVKALALGDNQIFNISTHSKTSIKELAETITNQFHMNCSIIYQAGRVGDIEDSILNNNKAKVILNWLPQHKLIDGLKKTIDFYR
jgi:UDP-glucose 4-epimerase